MKKKIGISTLLAIAIAAFFLISAVSQFEGSYLIEEEDRSQGQVKEDSAKIYDGPYIFWKGNRATVQYVWEGKKQTQVYDVQDSVRIPWRFGDSEKPISIAVASPMLVPETFSGVTKICAISDIHGQFDKMTKLLKAIGIIDDRLQWNWGNGHLVVTGDMFDRGAKVTEILWFIHELEKEAQTKGGRIHYLLGNHDIMVMRGDIRYVNKKYESVSKELKISIRDLYGPETEFGRWLRSKNVIVKINDILFVHAGVSPEVCKRGYTVQMINEKIRNSIDARDYTIQFDDDLKMLYGYEGPIWYRGYIMDWQGIPKATEEQVKSILDFYSARAVAVGHTIVEKLTPLHRNRVFAIETGMSGNSEGEALLWENGLFYRLNALGHRETLE